MAMLPLFLGPLVDSGAGGWAGEGGEEFVL